MEFLQSKQFIVYIFIVDLNEIYVPFQAKLNLLINISICSPGKPFVYSVFPYKTDAVHSVTVHMVKSQLVPEKSRKFAILKRWLPWLPWLPW